MQIDVCYKAPRELIWSNINRFVSPDSIDMAIYRPCLDIYSIKKTLWNSASRLHEQGLLCIECVPENISNVIKIIAEMKLEYKIIHFFTKNSCFQFVIAHRGFNNTLVSMSNVIQINDFVIDVPEIVLTLVPDNSIILLIGNEATMFGIATKKTHKHVIAFSDFWPILQMLTNQGVRVLEV